MPRLTRLWRTLTVVFGLMVAVWIAVVPAAIVSPAQTHAAADQVVGAEQHRPMPVVPVQAFGPGIPGGGGGIPGGGIGQPPVNPNYVDPNFVDPGTAGPGTGGPNYVDPGLVDPGEICNPDLYNCNGIIQDEPDDPCVVNPASCDPCVVNPALCNPCNSDFPPPGCGGTSTELQCPEDPTKCEWPVPIVCPPNCPPPVGGCEVPPCVPPTIEDGGCPPRCPPGCPADPAQCPKPGHTVDETPVPRIPDQGVLTPGASAVRPVADPTTPPVPQGLELSIAAVPVGEDLTVSGTGCSPGAPVEVTFGGVPAGTATADATGRFEAPLSAAAVETGRYQVSAECGGAAPLTAPLDVVLVSSTGGSSSTMVVIVFFLLVGLLVFRRRLLPVEPR